MSTTKLRCGICGKDVFKPPRPMAGYYKLTIGGEAKETQIDINGMIFHKTCLKCNICGCLINSSNIGNINSTINPYSVVCQSHDASIIRKDSESDNLQEISRTPSDSFNKLPTQSYDSNAELLPSTLNKTKSTEITDSDRSSRPTETDDLKISFLSPSSFILNPSGSVKVTTPMNWLIQQVDEWLKLDNKKIYVISSEAGMGKTVFASFFMRYLEDNNKLLAYYSCDSEGAYNLPNAMNLFNSLARQVATFCNSSKLAVSSDIDILSYQVDAKLDDVFERLIMLPLESIKDRDQTKVIVIDAADRVGSSGSKVRIDWQNLIANSLTLLPNWIKVVLTTRPDEDILQCIPEDAASSFTLFEVNSTNHQLLDEISSYVRNRIGDKLADVNDMNDVVNLIVSRSYGVFVYVELVLKRYFFDERKWTVIELIRTLPNGLEQACVSTLKNLADTETKLFGKYVRPLLSLLVTMQKPLNVSDVQAILKIQDELLMEKLCGCVAPLYPTESLSTHPKKKRFIILHRAISECLTSKKYCGNLVIESTPGHELFVIDLLRQIQGYTVNTISSDTWKFPPPSDPKSNYLYAHLIDHLYGSNRASEAKLLMCRLGWLMNSLESCGMSAVLYEFKKQVTSVSKEKELSLIMHTLALSSSNLHMDGKLYSDRLPLQILGRLRSLVDYQVTSKKSGIVSRLIRRVGSFSLRRSSSNAADLLNESSKLAILQSLYKECKVWWISRKKYYPLRLPLAPPGGVLQHSCYLPSFIYAVAVVTDGVWACGCEDGKIYVMREESEFPETYLEGHSGSVRALAVNFAGLLISGSDDKTLRVWDMNTYKCQYTLLGHSGDVRCVVALPDGRVASGSMDCTIRIWNISSRECVRQYIGHSGWVNCITALPNSKIATGSVDETIRIWDVNSISEDPCKIIRGHSQSINSLTHLIGDILVSASRDSTVRIWDISSGKCVRELVGHTEDVKSVVSVLKGTKIVSCSYDKVIRVWDPNTGSCVRELKGHTEDVNALCVTLDGRVLSGSTDKSLCCWNVNTGDNITSGADRVLCIAVFDDGRVVSGSNDSSIRIWDSNTGFCIQTLRGHTWDVLTIAILPDGRIASGSTDKTARIWDSQTGAYLRKLTGHTGSVRAVVAVSDTELVTASDDKTLRVWNPTTGDCLRKLVGHTGRVRCATLLSNGKVASGSDDKILKIWDVTSGECILELKGHADAIVGVVNLSNGNIGSCSTDKQILTFDPSSGQCLTRKTGDSLELRRMKMEMEDPTSAEISTYGLVNPICVARGRGDGRVASGNHDGNVFIFIPSRLVQID